MTNQVEEMNRERISITLPKECIAWIDRKVTDRTYANRSHAIEVLILEAISKEKNPAHTRNYQLLTKHTQSGTKN
jgi:metal-responsive CopG/Arc/MetJ family transcriptional regulator